MGMIYRAHDPLIDRKVAIKLIRADLLDGAERADYLVRFQREAQAAGRCAHPNIVAIYDYALHEGNPYLAMEYVEGSNLSQVLAQSGRFSPTAAVAVIGQVLDALTCAHGLGIVHRDVKSANILLLPDQRVKMTDFGISRIDASALTQTGSVIGTPSYMSPEQCRGDTVDARSDIFSAGIVLYEMLCGKRPFVGRNMTDIVYQLMTQPPPDIHTISPDVPASLVAVMERAMAKQPEHRFPSAGAMAAALRQPVQDDRTVITPRSAVTSTETRTTTGTVARRLAVEGERDLAVHVGPIARILVKRAMEAAKSPDDFWRRLASHIERDADRRAFLRKHGALRE
jgi:serine/threonine protein kinase